MHLEFLIEDSSGMRLLESLVPRLLGENGFRHSWRLHPYKGVGRIPKGLKPNSDASKRMLLDQLPRLLKGFAKNPNVDKVVVIVDSDSRPCGDFLGELKDAARECGAEEKTIFRLAIEEIEAWYFGDQAAIRSAYPKARAAVLSKYVQDSVCGTWEILADATHPGGSKAISKIGWIAAGQIKHEWATRIGPFMNLDENNSPSFKKFRDGVLSLVTKKP